MKKSMVIVCIMVMIILTACGKKVSLNVTPADSRITYNDNEYTSPAEIDITDNTIPIFISREGYHDKTIDVTQVDKTNVLSVELNKIIYNVKIRPYYSNYYLSNPHSLSIDGRPYEFGKSINLSHGSHSLVISFPFYDKKYEQNLVVESKGIIEVNTRDFISEKDEYLQEQFRALFADKKLTIKLLCSTTWKRFEQDHAILTFSDDSTFLMSGGLGTYLPGTYLIEDNMLILNPEQKWIEQSDSLKRTFETEESKTFIFASNESNFYYREFLESLDNKNQLFPTALGLQKGDIRTIDNVKIRIDLQEYYTNAVTTIKREPSHSAGLLNFRLLKIGIDDYEELITNQIEKDSRVKLIGSFTDTDNTEWAYIEFRNGPGEHAGNVKGWCLKSNLTLSEN